MIGQLITYLLKGGCLKWWFVGKFDFCASSLSYWRLSQIYKATRARASSWSRLLSLIINSFDLLKVSSLICSHLIAIASLSSELICSFRFEHEKLLQIRSLLLALLYIAISICLAHHSTLWGTTHAVIYELIVHVGRIIGVLIANCTSKSRGLCKISGVFSCRAHVLMRHGVCLNRRFSRSNNSLCLSFFKIFFIN